MEDEENGLRQGSFDWSSSASETDQEPSQQLKYYSESINTEHMSNNAIAIRIEAFSALHCTYIEWPVK